MRRINVKDYEISEKDLNEMREEYASNKTNTIVRHALSKNLISDVVYDSKNESNTNFDFSIVVKTLPVCNQKSSGRCWIFAACNVLREDIAKELNLENFELSQNYVAFYDKLEKANYLLSSIADLVEEEHDERVLKHVLQSGVSDGGQWDMYVNLIKKYGLVPKSVMKETVQSSNTRQSNQLINALCRRFAKEAKELYLNGKENEILALKKSYITKIYTLLSDCFGVPPTEFDFEYTDKENVYHIEKGLNPHTFFEKYVGEHINDYVSLINSPTEDKEYYKTFTIDYLNNVIETRGIKHLNLPMERIKELIIAQLKDDKVVWFGSDVGFYGDRTNGIWDDQSFDYESAFGFDLKFDKAAMLDYYASCMNHAMCITGVNLIDGKENRRKIENSWGGDAGNKGYYVMSSTWFDRFVYQAVIDKKYLNEKELEAYSKDPIVLKPWDPMGTLA